VELASIGDNPIVVADDEVALSGGNFHGAPIGIPLDTVAIAVCELASLSQCRTRLLVDCPFPVGLPPKLAADPSEQLGLLLQNTAAAALVSELRACGLPASTESIGVDAMEDHVSMAAVAARKALRALGLARSVVAIELYCAAQALDFHGVELASDAARRLHAAVRERVPFQAADAPASAAVLEELVADAAA
jgi:histidine ammonia-lyase